MRGVPKLGETIKMSMDIDVVEGYDYCHIPKGTVGRVVSIFTTDYDDRIVVQLEFMHLKNTDSHSSLYVNYHKYDDVAPFITLIERCYPDGIFVADNKDYLPDS